MPQISVIVPVYRVERDLPRCLDSIVAQTFTDWECILIDDGSPDNSGVICDSSRPTTEKRRVMAGGQQMLREDLENTAPLDDKLRQQMVSKLIDLVRSKAVDAVIFEDYAKGVLSSWMLEEILIETRKAGIPTALDPKPGERILLHFGAVDFRAIVYLGHDEVCPTS